MILTLIQRLLIATVVLTLVAASGFAAMVDRNNCLASGVYLNTMMTTTGGTTYQCEIGDKTFSNFTIAFTNGTYTGGEGPSTPDPTTQVIMYALGATGSSTASGYPLGTGDIGLEFDFTGNNIAPANQFMELKIEYTVTVPNANYNITSVYTQANGGTIGTPLGGAYAEAIKNLCDGASFGATGIVPNFTCQSGGTPVNGAGTASDILLGSFQSYQYGTKTFTGTKTLGVYDDIKIYGASTGTTQAEVTAVLNTFGQSPTTGTPEPATFLLLGSALLGLGFLRRKRA